MTVPTLAAPDVAAALITKLTQAGFMASVQVPDPRPTEFVTVLEVGGAGRQDLVLYRASFQWHAWSTTTAAARALGASARTTLLGLAGENINGVQVYRVSEAGGIAVRPDPASKQSRVGGTMEFWVREQAP